MLNFRMKILNSINFVKNTQSIYFDIKNPKLFTSTGLI